MHIYVWEEALFLNVTSYSSADFVSTYISRDVKYHEPEFWKFGEEGNKYFRHATGQIYAVSKDLATYISINQYVHGFFTLYLIGNLLCRDNQISNYLPYLQPKGFFECEIRTQYFYKSLCTIIVL